MTHLCESNELPEGHSRGYRHVLLVRRAGRVYAYLNRCPHRNVPLEWQADRFLDESGSLIQCATHGALFLIESGECVAGPCSGRFLQPLAVEERDGAIRLLPANARDT
ncbi:Rieske (2Fe-2S) protein [Stutzerimonas azotifigens]|uniref:Rieske (2Fe-2S) protein n=1 Tax=Stutzerimonas azotifigens TaxID=291995 RepID=UPI0004004F0B|nr:Rieske (2Fe-2S) protein [Stutzerimonas azotifigens]